MRKIMRINFAFALAIAFCFFYSIFAIADSGNLDTKDRDKKCLQKNKKMKNIPIWQITQEGTSKPVIWVDHDPNARFAIYDPNDDSTDDPSTWEDDLVLDKETGLVWERSPDDFDKYGWVDACITCGGVRKGRRMGWRLPTREELGSLVDPGADDSPSLPVGNPFNIISDAGTGYWSRSTVTGYLSNAWRYGFNLGSSVGIPKDREGLRWCVRGGFAHDAFPE